MEWQLYSVKQSQFFVFYTARHKNVILTAPCPREANMRNTYLHGSITSVLKGSSPQDILPYSRDTISLIHALRHHQIYVGRQMPWPSHIQPLQLIVKISHNQTRARLTSYDHSIPINVTPLNIRKKIIPTSSPNKRRTYVR